MLEKGRFCNLEKYEEQIAIYGKEFPLLWTESCFWVEILLGVDVTNHKFTGILVKEQNIWGRICKKETDCIRSASKKSYVWVLKHFSF